MESYIQQIIKFYQKNALDNNVIIKNLAKKEEIYPIRNDVVAELEQLKELILELIKLDFSQEEILEEAQLFMKSSSYLNFESIDVKSLVEYFITSEVNQENKSELPEEVSQKKTKSTSQKIQQNDSNDYVDNTSLKVVTKNEIINEKLNILNDFTIEKDFEKHIFTEYLVEKAIDNSLNIIKMLSDATLETLSNGTVEKQLNNYIQNFKIDIDNFLDDYDIDKIDLIYYDIQEFVHRATEITRDANLEINYRVNSMKMLQDYSKGQSSSFFVGNLGAMVAFGALKGISSVCNNVSNYNQRRNFKNELERQVMEEYYNFLNENYDNIFSNIILETANLNEKNMDDTINFLNKKHKFEEEYNKERYYENYEIIEMLKLYPYSTHLWKKYIFSLDIDKFYQLEEISRNNGLKILERLISENKCEIILSNTDDLNQIYIAISNIDKTKNITNTDEILNFIRKIFENRFNCKISSEEVELFCFVIMYLCNEQFRKEQNTKKENVKLINIIELIKANKDKILEEHYNKNPYYLLAIREEIKTISVQILMTKFLDTENIPSFIDLKYNEYIETIEPEITQNLQAFQKEINNNLSIIRKQPLRNRGILKFFLMSDCFDIAQQVKSKILNSIPKTKELKRLKNSNVHLFWETKESRGILLLTTLIITIKKETCSIMLNTIEKISLKNGSLVLSLKDNTINVIPFFNEKELTDEKADSIKAIGIYIKSLLENWKKLQADKYKIYLSDYLYTNEIKNSKPDYVLEYIFNKNLIYEQYLREFLKKGFVENMYFEQIKKKEEQLNQMLNIYRNKNSRLIVYPIDEKDNDALNNLIIKSNFKKNKEKIIACCRQKDDFTEDESAIILTESNLFITVNKFGVIPLDIIKELTVSGFITQTLEILTFKNKFECLLFTSGDENQLFVKLVNNYLSFRKN